MAEINTPEDWWSVVDAQWSKIIGIFQNCNAPLDGHVWRDEIFGEEVFHGKTLAVMLEEAKADRDHDALGHFLDLLWAAAPDKPYIHSWPGWGDLCDLCSERWVFDPEPVADPD